MAVRIRRVPNLDLTDLELETAARAWRALARQEEQAAKRMESRHAGEPYDQCLTEEFKSCVGCFGQWLCKRLSGVKSAASAARNWRLRTDHLTFPANCIVYSTECISVCSWPRITHRARFPVLRNADLRIGEIELAVAHK